MKTIVIDFDELYPYFFFEEKDEPFILGARAKVTEAEWRKIRRASEMSHWLQGFLCEKYDEVRPAERERPSCTPPPPKAELTPEEQKQSEEMFQAMVRSVGESK